MMLFFYLTCIEESVVLASVPLIMSSFLFANYCPSEVLLSLLIFCIFYLFLIQDAFVVCKIFHKSGMGPKAGEQYGAPFDEEEWEDAELDLQAGPMPSVTIAVPSADKTPSSLHLNNSVQPPDLQAGPIPSVIPCPLQPHTSSGMDCNGTGVKESPSPVELSFDIVHLQELVRFNISFSIIKSSIGNKRFMI